MTRNERIQWVLMKEPEGGNQRRAMYSNLVSKNETLIE